jgi:hypothetical protein
MAEQDGDLLTDGTDTEPTEDTDNQQNAGPEGSDATSVETDGAKQRPGWMDQLAGDLKNNETLYRFKSANDAVKSLLEAEGKLGRSVTISEKPTAEELSRLYALLGRPESPDKYDFAEVKLPEGVTVPKKAEEELRRIAHENGLTNAQASKLIEWNARRETEAVRQVQAIIKQSKEEATAALKEKHGEDFPKLINAAQQLVATKGTDGLKTKLKTTNWGNDPDFVEFVGTLALERREGNAPDTETPPDPEPKETAFPVAASIGAKYKSIWRE